MGASAAAGASVLAKIGTARSPRPVTELKHKIDVNTQERHTAAKTTSHFNVGYANFSTDQPIAFEPLPTTDTGGFILIDRQTNADAAARHRSISACAAPPTCTGAPWTWNKQQVYPLAPGPAASDGSPACPAPASRDHANLVERRSCRRWGQHTHRWTVATTSATAFNKDPLHRRGDRGKTSAGSVRKR